MLRLALFCNCKLVQLTGTTAGDSCRRASCSSGGLLSCLLQVSRDVEHREDHGGPAIDMKHRRNSGLLNVTRLPLYGSI